MKHLILHKGTMDNILSSPLHEDMGNGTIYNHLWICSPIHSNKLGE